MGNPGEETTQHLALSPAPPRWDNFTIFLAFSGGGLRATLFHLGVLRFLKQCNCLSKVSHITSVSGGSITAGHLLQNWDRYAKGDDRQFIQAADDLIKGAALYGIREHVAYNLSRPQKRFSQLHKCYLKGLAHDGRDTELKSIIDTPEFHILGTDFSTGQLVEFSRHGIALLTADEDGKLTIERPAQNSTDAEFGLWKAVACSSSFPPMFPPHLISPKEYASNSSRNITVGDGGVYDNLGIGLVELLAEREPLNNIMFIISDAGLPFRNGLVSSASYKWALDRMTRASDIQFYRVADSDVRHFRRQIAGADSRRLVTLRIGDILSGKNDDCVLDEEVQKLVGNVRTDLDTFHHEELHAVIQHGWALARSAIRNDETVQFDYSKCMAWNPGGSEVTQDQMRDRLKESGRRKFYWRPLWSPLDFGIAIIPGLLLLWLLLYPVFNLFGFHVIGYSRYHRLIAIESGQVGVFAEWSYNLDKDEAVVLVQSSKMPKIVGRSYVILVMRMPTDGTPLEEETKTVVSKVQRFHGVSATAIPDHISFARFANTVEYGDQMTFLLYVIPDAQISAVQHAIDTQVEQPLTINRITKDFGGIKIGGGMDAAKFEVGGGLIENSVRALTEKRTATK